MTLREFTTNLDDSDMVVLSCKYGESFPYSKKDILNDFTDNVLDSQILHIDIRQLFDKHIVVVKCVD